MFKKYDAYKDSGVEWLGQLPSCWDLLSNKYIFKLKKDLVGKKSKDYELLSLTLNGVIKRDMENPEGKFPAEFDTYQKVQVGDFIFCHFDVEETPRTIGLSTFNGMITGAYTVYQVDQSLFNAKFLYYFYLNLDVGKRLKPLYKGLRNTIGKDVFGEFKTFIPTKDEQRQIAEFLDQKTAEIDQAIAIKEQQIALLNERKQIVIQKAVTQGLNPNVAMKDSGVEWIGQIPEHWETSKIRYLGTTQNGISAGGDYFGIGYPFVSYSDVYKNRVLPECVEGLANSTLNDQKSFSVQEGDIFFTRTSETIDEIGFTSVCFKTIENAVFAGFLIRFRPFLKAPLIKEFSKYYFSSPMMRAYFVKEMNLVIRASLSQELLKNLDVLLPDIEEQKAIAEYLDDLTGKIENAVLIKYSEIEKLKEYKTTLINDAVTGKIKVA